jgi:hypothetical protein
MVFNENTKYSIHLTDKKEFIAIRFNKEQVHNNVVSAVSGNCLFGNAVTSLWKWVRIPPGHWID